MRHVKQALAHSWLGDPVAGPLLKGGMSAMAVRVAGTLLSFASHVVLSRTLGVHDYGIYAIALGWILVLTILSRLGLDNAALRFASIYREEGRHGALRGFTIVSIMAIAASSALLALALIFGKLLGVPALRSVSWSMVIWVAAVIVPLSLAGWFSALIRTMNQIFASQFYEQVLRPSLLIGLIAAAVVIGWRLDSSIAMGLTFASTAMAFLAIAAHGSMAVHRLGPAAADYSERRTWLSVSWVLLILSLVQELLNQADLLLLGMLATASQAAQFAAASRLASLITFGLVAIAYVSGPAIAIAYRQQDMARLARIARFNARASFAFAAVVSLVLALFGPIALSVFGPAFQQSYPALLILLVGGLVNAGTGSAAYFLTLTGHQLAALKILSVALLVSILLNVLLIPGLGIVGSAIAASCGLSFWNLAMVFYVRRRLGIDASALGLRPLAITGKQAV